ncbi:hypothetical protein KPSA1_04108 [Pseudomonas syringae pv. actinidiae]|uniref:Uncharacterized protein n=1 Tax=Pseudomonas syringae pv. actinidiae TaxID=103796 RepID=A0A2V0QJ61_PSESF|nr:hypothetical protein KPSA1_04108 [Pseudomonas syringae pv. actinidiae]
MNSGFLFLRYFIGGCGFEMLSAYVGIDGQDDFDVSVNLAT